MAATMTANHAQHVVDRQALRAELEATCDTFRALVEALPDEQWHAKSPGSAWTVCETMAHLVWALEQLPREIASARQGKGMFNYPRPVSDAVSYWLVRWLARRATRRAIVGQYQAAMAAVLATLDTVAEQDWTAGARFYGHGFYSIESLLHTPAHHLAEHTSGLSVDQQILR